MYRFRIGEAIARARARTVIAGRFVTRRVGAYMRDVYTRRRSPEILLLLLQVQRAT